LPHSWLNGTINLRLEAVGEGIQFKEVAGPIANDGCVEVTFDPIEELEVRFVAAGWTENGITHSPTAAQLFELAQRLTAVYPIASLDWTTGSWLIPFVGQPTLEDVNFRLEVARFLDCIVSGDWDRLWYGVLVDASVSGLANGIPGTVASGIFTGINTFAYYRNTHAHELGHVLGRHHAVNQTHFGTTTRGGKTYKLGPCGSIAAMSAPEFPYIYNIAGNDRATIGPMDLGQDSLIYGFDTHSMRVVDPGSHFELMSYCGHPDVYRWISDDTYEALQNIINDKYSSSIAMQSFVDQVSFTQDYLVIRGTVDFQNDTAEFLPFMFISNPISPPPEPSPGDYTLELLDDANNLVVAIPFQPTEYVADLSVEDPCTGSFIIPVPADPSTKRAIVTHNGIQLALQVMSANPPTVQVLFPNGGEVFDGNNVTIEWTANDADGDELVYLIEYSTNAGGTWEVLAIDWPEMSYEIEREYLTATTAGLIRVMASDGFNSGADESDAVFTVLNNAPHVIIVTPEQYSLFTGEQLIFLEAGSLDREDGQLSDEGLEWSSNIDGLLGTGRLLTHDAKELSEGYHEITVTATDSEGLIDTASVNIWVFREPPSNVPPSADAGPDQVVECSYNSEQATKVGLNGTGSSDPDGDPLTYTWTGPFDESPIHGSTPTVTLSNSCPGNYVITLVVNDGTENSNPDEVVITVQDPVAALTYDGDTLLSTAGNPTVDASLIATLRDTGGNVLDIDDARVSFTLTAEGVGTIAVDVNSQDGLAQVVLSLEPAIYKIDMTLDCSAVTPSAILVVYNPEGGFATGGGWIIPADDGLNTHPNVRANFGFNAKYKQDDPTGHLEFRYSDGFIDLKSTSIEQLVITGGKIVQFKGWASVNKVDGHWFFVKAIDNRKPGTSDTFDIKVWAPGVDPEGDPTDRAGGVLQGGNIVVHTK
jgi:hypothetical protein